MILFGLENHFPSFAALIFNFILIYLGQDDTDSGEVRVKYSKYNTSDKKYFDFDRVQNRQRICICSKESLKLSLNSLVVFNL